jgi:hypothetical protein
MIFPMSALNRPGQGRVRKLFEKQNLEMLKNCGMSGSSFLGDP